MKITLKELRQVVKKVISEASSIVLTADEAVVRFPVAMKSLPTYVARMAGNPDAGGPWESSDRTVWDMFEFSTSDGRTLLAKDIENANHGLTTMYAWDPDYSEWDLY